MTILEGMMLGAVAGGLAFFATVKTVHFIQERKMLATYADAKVKRLFFSYASVSSNFFPLVNTLFDNYDSNAESRIRIIGGDGRYILSNRGGKLIDGIKGLINDGISIDYILICPNEMARQKFKNVAEEIGRDAESSATLRVCDFSKDGAAQDSAVKELGAKYRNYHPTLIDGGDGDRALWLEMDHPDDSIYAYNVYFTSFSVMKNRTDDQEKFALYEKDIETLIGHSDIFSSSMGTSALNRDLSENQEHREAS